MATRRTRWWGGEVRDKRVDWPQLVDTCDETLARKPQGHFFWHDVNFQCTIGNFKYTNKKNIDENAYARLLPCKNVSIVRRYRQLRHDVTYARPIKRAFN